MVKKKGTKSKKVCETFKIEKDGNEALVESCGVEEEKIATKEQIKKNNKIFKIILFVMAGLIVMFLMFLFMNKYINRFKVDGVQFEVDTTTLSGIKLYTTSLPVIYNGERTKYNFYLRLDPRKTIRETETNGEINFKKNIVVEITTENLFCEGDWTIALTNFQTLCSLMRMNVLAKNESLTYTPEDQYMFLTINKGNNTEINKLSENSYEMNINNCEVLEGFERLMLEMFIQYENLE